MRQAVNTLAAFALLLIWSTAAALAMLACILLGVRRTPATGLSMIPPYPRPIHDRDPGDETSTPPESFWCTTVAPSCPRCRSEDVSVRERDGATWCNACQRVYYPAGAVA